jgi:hypothetical protein
MRMNALINPFRYISFFLLLLALLSNHVCLGLPPARQTPLDAHPDLRAGTILAPNITHLGNNNTPSNSTTVGHRDPNSNSFAGSNLNSSTPDANDPDDGSSDDEDLDDDDDDDGDDYEDDGSEQPASDDVSAYLNLLITSREKAETCA